MGVRQWLYRELVPEAREGGISPLNGLIVLLVVASLIALALETEPVLIAQPGWLQGFAIFNGVVLAAFAVEYLLRFWVAGLDPQYAGVRGRIRYVTRFYSLADLLAFLPELIILLMGGGIPLIFLRILRLARLFKIARFVPAFDALRAAIQRSAVQLGTSLALALSLLYIASVLLYFVEGLAGNQQEDFASIPRAMWWAVATLTTVGYGDVYPVTPLGRMCSAIIAIAGIGVVALPAGIFASAFSDELRERKDAKLKARLAELDTARAETDRKAGT